MSKLMKILPWAAILLYSLIMLPLIGAQKGETVCSNVQIDIEDDNGMHFVEPKDVMRILNDKRVKLKGNTMDSIDRNETEEILLRHSLVKDAEVYKSLNGTINIQIEQRTPILRVVNRESESFYIDEEGRVMPVSDKYAAHVPVANGNIGDNYSKRRFDQLKIVNPDSIQEKDVLSKLYTLAVFIHDNEFWKAQIEQIYVNGSEFELVPKVGAHVVVFGSLENYPEKFRNLHALYKQGFPQKGWNRYSKVNVKYKNQIICTKR